MVDTFLLQDEEQEQRRKAEMIELGQRRFVTNLLWQVMDSRSKREARKLATETKNAFGVIRGLEEGGQVGLAGIDDDVKTGLPALADVVASVYRANFENFIFAMPLADWRVYLCVVREGAILPDGDVILDFGELDGVFAQYRGMGNWDAYIIPPELEGLRGFDQTQVIDNREFISILNQPAFIKKLPTLKALTAVAHRQNQEGKTSAKEIIMDFLGNVDKRVYYALALFIIVGLGGFLFYMEYLKKMQEQRLAEQARLKALRAEKIAEGWIIPLKWRDMPDGKDVFDTCASALNKTPPVVGSWRMSGFTCAPSGAQATYEKGIGASMAMLAASFPDSSSGGNLEDTNASVDVPLKEFDKMPGPVSIAGLLTPDEVLLNIDYFCANTGLQCAASFRKLPDHVNPVTEETKPMPYGLVEYEVAMPYGMRWPFNAPGSTIDNIEVKIDESQMHVHGSTYVRLQRGNG